MPAKYYELVDDADTTVRKDYKCTKSQFCERGETRPQYTRLESSGNVW